MKTHKLPVDLTDEQIEAFGRELDAIRDEIFDSRGEKDRAYILKVIKTQRSLALCARMVIYASLFFLPAWGHALAIWPVMLTLLGLGTFMLGIAKILENMEIAHNVVHHTWTNVLEKDLDVGYGIMRVTPLQKWKPAYLLQPIYFILLMLLFEEGVALHEQAIDDHLKGKNKFADFKPLMKRIGYKIWRQVAKDYIAWPLAAALVAIPISLFVDFSPLAVFGIVAGANAVANLIRNIWAFMIIFCGHFPAGAHNFTVEQVEGETRARWYLRQLLGSCNIEGGKLFHVLSGNLSHQIEHHLFPDMCSNRYKEASPRVRALADRYGLPYNSASLFRQFGTTWLKNIRLAFPGGGEPWRGTPDQATSS